MTANRVLTTLAIEGMLETKLAEEWHPTQPVTMPFTLAEWDLILKALQQSRDDIEVR